MREPIDSFLVDWDTSIDDFAHAKQQRSYVEEPTDFLKALFEYVQGTKRGNRHTGAEFRALYESDLEISGEWRFERPVGSGSFGVAALFKRYQFDEIIDDVVVKDALQREIGPVSKKRPSLSREAAVMAQTNELNDASLLRLRSYKHLEDAKQYR